MTGVLLARIYIIYAFMVSVDGEVQKVGLEIRFGNPMNPVKGINQLKRACRPTGMVLLQQTDFCFLASSKVEGYDNT